MEHRGRNERERTTPTQVGPHTSVPSFVGHRMGMSCSTDTEYTALYTSSALSRGVSCRSRPVQLYGPSGLRATRIDIDTPRRDDANIGDSDAFFFFFFLSFLLSSLVDVRLSAVIGCNYVVVPVDRKFGTVSRTKEIEDIPNEKCKMNVCVIDGNFRGFRSLSLGHHWELSTRESNVELLLRN